jgi:hypothetical protein
MTAAKLTVFVDWDSDRSGIGAGLPSANMELDIEVNEGDEPVTIVIQHDTVSCTSKTEPRVVPVLTNGFQQVILRRMDLLKAAIEAGDAEQMRFTYDQTLRAIQKQISQGGT